MHRAPGPGMSDSDSALSFLRLRHLCKVRGVSVAARLYCLCAAPVAELIHLCFITCHPKEVFRQPMVEGDGVCTL